MARVKSANVPLTSRSVALDTSTAEWAIMPGKINPMAMVNSATTTKISSNAVISAVSWRGTLSMAMR